MDNKELNKSGHIYTLNRLLKEGKITQEQYDKRMDIIEQS